MHVLRRVAFSLLLGCLGMSPLLVSAQTPRPKEPEALKRADAAFRAGYAAQQAGNLELARAKFADAVRLAPQIPEAHEALGAVLVQLDKPREAIPELETALKLKPADAGIETNLALAYGKAGEPQKAVPLFAAVYAASLQPGQQPLDASVCEAYAWALAAVGKKAEAIELFQSAVPHGGGAAGAHQLLSPQPAEHLHRQADLEDAARRLPAGAARGGGVRGSGEEERPRGRGRGRPEARSTI